MVFVLAVYSQSKVLVTGLWQTVLLVQNVQDSHQFCLHKVWEQQLQFNFNIHFPFISSSESTGSPSDSAPHFLNNMLKEK